MGRVDSADHPVVRDDRYTTLLRGEALLVALLGAALALFLVTPALRTVWHLPALELVLATLFALAAGLLALLSATRFAIDGRLSDAVLCGGALVTAGSWLAFSVGPAIVHGTTARPELWAAVDGRIVGWAAIAAAPFVGGRRSRHGRTIAVVLVAAVGLLVGTELLSRELGNVLPTLDGGRLVPPPLMGALAAQALVHLLAALGFTDRFRQRGDDLDRWLALGSVLMLFASLHLVFTPPSAADQVSQGDFLQVLAYGVLLAGVWRAIRAAEFGRAVAEERARLARELHDGLAQYLFAISANVSLLEAGADPGETLPALRDAAAAAQHEARYAILALSSAAGRSPFDAALRRYVDVVRAGGELEVDVEIDPAVRLSADEQIEAFRIVQEGLANARRHAGARRAWVTVSDRGRERVVSVRDDGRGFSADGATGGFGLRNMRDRAASVGGSLALLPVAGGGTSVELVLPA